MNILCWNVRGLGNPRAFLALKRVIKRLSPNLVFVCETRLHKGEADRIRCLLGFEGVLQVESVGKSGGLLLFWKDWEVSVLSFSKRHIDVRVKMENGVRWQFFWVLWSPSPPDRAASWELPRRLRRVDKFP
ncbi:hypothetical protein Dsin_019732 [Dipteronia sinensis]|uniref:Endonuclease/exonuclease/phosphatase domain-containing protein n=1 Tax=Dipteronia sinensis TaxID=43782 RepID=A0AAE0A7Y0_9ROSI|nr:hypothetical protein Dsin_019732 [Dipteronia sinensis]